MDMLPLLTVIGGVMLSIIGFFLKKTMDDLRSVKEMSYDNKSKIELLQNDYNNKHNNLSEKFDELKLTMNELIKEIKELNKRIK
jgi:peptidoglycan hydrolase CwlO-like protein